MKTQLFRFIIGTDAFQIEALTLGGNFGLFTEDGIGPLLFKVFPSGHEIIFLLTSFLRALKCMTTIAKGFAQPDLKMKKNLLRMSFQHNFRTQGWVRFSFKRGH